ncbi:ABC transporter ATP-binding protein [Brachybacterium kimchii]|uniref:ABC transporter ATP-binding protein n=1 Tax=Brachybacterium kimchii TaxID=2942909 RepID=A0ABY4N855_9MICO|nr:ABC transporter ATP-binding protein [Brachybacterium kimchii]UQN29603.1 ABC transporter ATP-binding protein [Brachybacterium kimchii]
MSVENPRPGGAVTSDKPDAETPARLRDFSFRYRAQSEPTLRGIDLTVRRGEKIAIVGPSGCGKSTLLGALNGLVPHVHAGEASGSIEVFGTDPAAAPIIETSRRVGTVLQDSSGQFVGLTVAEDVAFSLENQQVPHAQMPGRVAGAARAAGIADHLDASPQQLSGGQKQRVAIAGVLVDDVEMLLFDEPLAMLDPAAGRAAVELIDDLHREQGRTIIVVEHRLEDLLHRPLDRIVLMDEGRIVADLPPDELLASPLLREHGIRPPLHVEALRLAGAPVTADQHPADLPRMELSSAQREAVRTWVESATPGQSRHTATAAQPTSHDALPALDLEHVGAILRRPGASADVRALRGVTARIRRGEMLGVIGSNGAGKSTLARVISGFEKATEGVVRIGGADAASWPLAEHGAHVGFVLQEPGQMLSQPLLEEEIRLGLRARGLDAEEIERRTARVLEVTDLRPMRSWPVSALSHGQRKRLSIACVLALEPEILILDEPTAGQDFAHYSEFMDFLARIHAEGTTIVLITHDMHLALEYTDRVLVISGGELLADTDPAAVLTDEFLAERADLVVTGLFTLARRCGIPDPIALVHRFVAADRAERALPTASGEDAR